jgi:hypothetical protein
LDFFEYFFDIFFCIFSFVFFSFFVGNPKMGNNSNGWPTKKWKKEERPHCNGWPTQVKEWSHCNGWPTQIKKHGELVEL